MDRLSGINWGGYSCWRFVFSGFHTAASACLGDAGEGHHGGVGRDLALVERTAAEIGVRPACGYT